jgi:3-oxoacyl-[acyl-carrier-protein] synthase II
MTRVVVTGMGGISPLGHTWQDVRVHLIENKNAIVYMKEWDCYKEMRTRLAAPIKPLELPAHYNRKTMRSMGNVALYATRSSELALEDAGLLGTDVVTGGQLGIAYGSSTGTPAALANFSLMLTNKALENITANSYIKMMPHTTSTNIGVFFGITGRIIPSSTACTSGSISIGYAYEAIKARKQIAMLAGGAEELCATEAAVFDVLYATEDDNQNPSLCPKPFDKKRGGLVIGEGAGTLLLESLDHARARGAHIYAEVVGFGTNSDGNHVTKPTATTMQKAMELALEDAGITAKDIGYINGHGTATDSGDVAESIATYKLFGNTVPFSSLKSYMGHTLGAAGSLEAWMSIHMMNEGWFAPNLNLSEIDSQCGEVDYIIGSPRQCDVDYIMSNNFAFGGVNTSLIFKKWAKQS